MPLRGVREARVKPVSRGKLQAYATTVLEFGGSGTSSIDLRRPIGAADLRLLAGLGLSGEFAVITAYNPRCRPSPPASRNNVRMQSRLEQELRSAGIVAVPVDGCSPDRQHREASVAVCIPEDRAREWAIRYRQDAIFWFDRSRFWIVGALEGFGRVPLPLGAGTLGG
ncbi:hypothetical protein BH23GEM3_BH23GEM3_21290 [soil metagenome]